MNIFHFHINNKPKVNDRSIQLIRMSTETTTGGGSLLVASSKSDNVEHSINNDESLIRAAASDESTLNDIEYDEASNTSSIDKTRKTSKSSSFDSILPEDASDSSRIEILTSQGFEKQDVIEALDACNNDTGRAHFLLHLKQSRVNSTIKSSETKKSGLYSIFDFTSSNKPNNGSFSDSGSSWLDEVDPDGSIRRGSIDKDKADHSALENKLIINVDSFEKRVDDNYFVLSVISESCRWAIYRTYNELKDFKTSLPYFGNHLLLGISRHFPAFVTHLFKSDNQKKDEEYIEGLKRGLNEWFSSFCGSEKCMNNPQVMHLVNKFISTGLETRGVTLELFRSIKTRALIKNDDQQFWTIGRVAAFIVGNKELVDPIGQYYELSDVFPPDSTITFKFSHFSDKKSLVKVLANYDAKAPIHNKHPQLGLSFQDAVQPVGRKADIYISYDVDDNYIDLVDALERLFRDKGYSEVDTFIYFDPFVNDQWTPTIKPFGHLINGYRETIESMRLTFLFVNPNDLKSIRNSRCLLEMGHFSDLSLLMCERDELEYKSRVVEGENSSSIAIDGSIDLCFQQLISKEWGSDRQEQSILLIKSMANDWPALKSKIVSAFKKYFQDSK